MTGSPGTWLFGMSPFVLAGFLLWRFPRSRQFRPGPLVTYVVVMSLLIWGALAVVAYLASARVVLREVPLILWFTISCRLAWEIWSQYVNRLGHGWCRWARFRRQTGRPVPCLVRLIPAGRASLTALVFLPVSVGVVATHRCKLADGQDPMSVFNLPYEHLRIPTRDGLMLDGWFIPENKPSDRTIVICHGAGANKGNFVWFLRPLAHSGYNVLFFDFRAHGSSDGRTTTYGIRERADVIAAVDWLKANRPHESRVVVGLGSSQGSMALALAAAEDARIDAVVLDSPFVSPRDLLRDNTRLLPMLGPLFADGMLALVSLLTGTSFFAVSAEKAVAAIGARPVLVIHGDGDFVMPRSHAERLYDAATGPRDIWFGPGPHSNIITQAPHEYADRMFGFLRQHLPRGEP